MCFVQQFYNICARVLRTRGARVRVALGDGKVCRLLVPKAWTTTIILIANLILMNVHSGNGGHSRSTAYINSATHHTLWMMGFAASSGSTSQRCPFDVVIHVNGDVQHIAQSRAHCPPASIVAGPVDMGSVAALSSCAHSESELSYI